MKKLFSAVAIVLVSATLIGCGDKDKDKYDFSYGYGDGYAAGYNTQCKIRGTLVAGEWDYPEYTRGYNAGYREGVSDCNNGVKL